MDQDPGTSAESFYDFAMSSGSGVLIEHADRLFELNVTARSLLRDGIEQQLVSLGIPPVAASDIIHEFRVRHRKGKCGIFWDYSQSGLRLDQAATTTLHAINSVRSRLSVYGPVQTMNLYTPAGSLSDRHAVALQDAGASIITIPHIRKRGDFVAFADKPIIVDSLIWAFQHLKEDPVVVIVSSDPEFSPLLSKLKSIGARSIMVTSDESLGARSHTASITLSWPSSFLPYFSVAPSQEEKQGLLAGHHQVGEAPPAYGKQQQQQSNNNNNNNTAESPKKYEKYAQRHHEPGPHHHDHNMDNYEDSRKTEKRNYTPTRRSYSRSPGGRYKNSNNNNNNRSYSRSPGGRPRQQHGGGDERNNKESPSRNLQQQQKKEEEKLQPSISVTPSSPNTSQEEPKQEEANKKKEETTTQSPQQQQQQQQRPTIETPKQRQQQHHQQHQKYVSLNLSNSPKWGKNNNPLSKMGIPFVPLLSTSFDHNSPPRSNNASKNPSFDASLPTEEKQQQQQQGSPTSSTSSSSSSSTASLSKIDAVFHTKDPFEDVRSQPQQQQEEQEKYASSSPAASSSEDHIIIDQLEEILQGLHETLGSGEISRAQVLVEVREHLGNIDVNALLNRAAALGKIDLGGVGFSAWVALKSKQLQRRVTSTSTSASDVSDTEENNENEKQQKGEEKIPIENDNSSPSPARPSQQEQQQQQQQNQKPGRRSNSNRNSKNNNNDSRGSRLNAPLPRSRSTSASSRHSASPRADVAYAWMSFRVNKFMASSRAVLEFSKNSLPDGIEIRDVEVRDGEGHDTPFWIRAFGPFQSPEEAAWFQKQHFSKLPFRPRFYARPPKEN